MIPESFSAKSPGRLVVSGDVFAFVPDPLPPNLEFDLATIQQISAADQALGELRGMSQMLPYPKLLVAPFSRREAIASSRIEGTIASARDLVLFDVSPIKESANSDVHEVHNYVRALELGLAGLKELPVCLRLIREIHKRLWQGVRGGEARPGEFRLHQNYIAKAMQSIQDARFVPPPASELAACLNEFEKHLHASSLLPPIVRLALIHYQFEAIHPFDDGNGRVGRLLLSLLISEWGLLERPLLSLSRYLEANRDEYVGHLLAVSQRGAWIDWIRFFARGVQEQARDAIDRSKKLLELRERYRQKMQQARFSANVLKLLDRLFTSPAITVGLAQQHLKVTYASARSNIRKLEEARILTPIPGLKYNQVFMASEIVRIIETDSL
jgi:Fic family protein